MKRFWIAGIGVLALLGGCAGSERKVQIQAPEGYELVWHDEFDGDNQMPDTALWWYETGGHGWGNQEIQRYVAGVEGTDTCALVQDGCLKIIARKSGDEVLSARINSRESWKYGYFEARLRLPAGKGTWPAFWMMPEVCEKWPDDGEIDIMEAVGYNPDSVFSTIHCSAYNHVLRTQRGGRAWVPTSHSEFHVYAVEWTPDSIKGMVDGTPYFGFANDRKGDKDTWPFDAAFYLKLNLAWGGAWGGAMGVDESALPAVYEIDYVRVFQKKID